jgi:hypothetical protein
LLWPCHGAIGLKAPVGPGREGGRFPEGTRALRRRIIEMLDSPDLEGVLQDLREIDARRAINALLSLLCNMDEALRWRAVTALGRIVVDLAREDMEAARIVMRRLMWSLNDESGGIGWGAPEAMAEVMAHHGGLAREYAPILLSYIREDGNYLEYEPLRIGALWGVVRLARARPEVAREIDAARFIRPYLRDGDPASRALAAWAVGILGDTSDCAGLRDLAPDEARVELFVDGGFATHTVGEVARRSAGVLCGS